MKMPILKSSEKKRRKGCSQAEIKSFRVLFFGFLIILKHMNLNWLDSFWRTECSRRETVSIPGLVLQNFRLQISFMNPSVIKCSATLRTWHAEEARASQMDRPCGGVLKHQIWEWKYLDILSQLLWMQLNKDVHPRTWES